MKLLLALLFSCTFFISQHAAAHGDHEYQEPLIISESVALIIAQRATTSMTRKDAGLGFGQLQQSWSAVPKDDMAIHKKGSGYYVVSVFNKGEEKTLYVLMSQVGEVYDANLTGEFDGI
ncbi:MAG: hypothetical protein ACJA2E_002264 [Arenicella sp.]|jgi:hypothetical protein